jgi:predicted transcriptional regulator
MPRSLASLVRRFTQAWHPAAAGEPVQDNHVTFLKVQIMMGTLSPRRLDLLRHVRQHGASNTRELALVLGRDYKNVHQDVAVLEATGLLIREGRKLSAPWDELQAHVSLLPS